MDHNSAKQTDLWWTAVCYVLDELPLEQRLAFEELLGHSQPAREAVAEAVALVDAIRASRSQPVDAHSTPIRTLPTSSSATLAGTLAVLSTVLLLALLALWAVGQKKPVADRALAPVAALWADLASEDEQQPAELDWLEADSMLEPADEMTVPEWLLAGVEEAHWR